MRILFLMLFVVVMSSLLSAGETPVGGKVFSLQVFENKPATAPPKDNIAVDKDFCVYFTIALYRNKKRVEYFRQAKEIERINYILTAEVVAESYAAPKAFSDMLLPRSPYTNFTKDTLDTIAGKAVYQYRQESTIIKPDGTTQINPIKILTAVVPKWNIKVPCKMSARLQVIVTLASGESITDSHTIDLTVLQYKISVFVQNGTIKKQKSDKSDRLNIGEDVKTLWFWDMAAVEEKFAKGQKITYQESKSVIGHAMWRMDSSSDDYNAASALISSDKGVVNNIKTNIRGKQVGFSTASQEDFQNAMQNAHITGNFSISVPGRLEKNTGGTNKGTFGLTKEDFAAGIKFIVNPFDNQDQDQYGDKHNCVDMAIEGLNAANITSEYFAQCNKDVKIRYLSASAGEQTAYIKLSLPNLFGEAIEYIAKPANPKIKPKFLEEK